MFQQPASMQRVVKEDNDKDLMAPDDGFEIEEDVDSDDEQ